MTPTLKQQIIDLINQMFNTNYWAGVPKIPPHTHNGIDNLKINASDIEGLTGGGTPSGSNTQIQFNDNGAFGASPDLVFDSATSTLGVNNISQVPDSGSPLTIQTTAPVPGDSTDLVLATADAETTGGNTEISGDISITTGLGYGNAGDILIQAGNSVTGDDGQIDIITNNGPINITAQGGSGAGSGDIVVSTSAGAIVISASASLIVVQYQFLIQDSAAPGFTPGGGGVLYSNAGALHWLGSSGTDTVIAPA